MQAVDESLVLLIPGKIGIEGGSDVLADFMAGASVMVAGSSERAMK